MIFPGQITTYIADLKLPWEYTWLEFDGLRVKEALNIAGLSPDTPVYHAKQKMVTTGRTIAVRRNTLLPAKLI